LDSVGEQSAALEELFAGLGSEEQLLGSIVSLEVDQILGLLGDS
jgi:hypothetical protein